MPTTKKESFYFGLMMCSGMVIVMTFYNLFMQDLLGVIPVTGIIFNLLLGFIVAFALDLYFVGPVARKIAFSLPIKQDMKIVKILTMSVLMVLGMVICMSLYGLITASVVGGLGEGSLLESYASIAMKNVILALPLQLIIMGPLVRYAFTKFVKRNEVSVA
ncbi:hypothetical protein [Oceanobacillus manasiensis]|uniref:hypothetical protein n=1 Tax=Oceanobacillus manasiensis TaxID=586413 RepID=UPI0005A6641F|nr:hypothetical protein [Oceanobacillus manasiensis]